MTYQKKSTLSTALLDLREADLTLLGTLRHLQSALMPEPLHPFVIYWLVVDSLIRVLLFPPEQSMDAGDAKSRILPFELLKLFEQ